MNERKIPCLVLDITGETEIILDKGIGSFRGHPKWKCNKIDCPIRTKLLPGEIGAAYRPLGVRLRTINKIHGVSDCEGGGKAINQTY